MRDSREKGAGMGNQDPPFQTLFDVTHLVSFLHSLHISRRKLLSEITTLGKLLLIMPATNALGE